MALGNQTGPSSRGTEYSAHPDIAKAITRLRDSIEQTRKLQSSDIEFDDPQVDATQKDIRDTIRDVFGTESPEYYDHSQHKIWHGSQIYLEARNKRQQKFSAGIPHTVSMLEGLISRLKDRSKVLKNKAPTEEIGQKVKKLEIPAKPEIVKIAAAEIPHHAMTRRVCVVHGSNDALKTAVCNYLEKLELEPVVLHKQQNSNRSIVEKIDTLPEVDYAVILLSADDFMPRDKLAKRANTQLKRNILYELGYYVGRLGQSRVLALYKGKSKLPGDYDGITCLAVDETSVWRRLLGLELKAAGFDIGIDEEA